MVDSELKEKENTPKKENERFQFYVPDHITKCEKQALLTFFKEYFEALVESKKFEGDEIVARKRTIVTALNDSYKNYEKHHEKFVTVLPQLVKLFTRKEIALVRSRLKFHLDGHAH